VQIGNSVGFMRAMFGQVKTGRHEFIGEHGYPGANGYICQVPDGAGGDSTHLCGRLDDDPVHFSKAEIAEMAVPLPKFLVEAVKG